MTNHRTTEDCIQDEAIRNLRTNDEKMYKQNEEIISSIKDIAVTQRTMQENQKDLKDTLTPIADTYRSVGKFSKWGMAFLVFISIVLSVIYNWTKVIGNK